MRKPKLIRVNPYNRAVVVFSFKCGKEKVNPKKLFNNVLNQDPFKKSEVDFYKTYIERYFDGSDQDDAWEGRTYCLTGGHAIMLINENLLTTTKDWFTTFPHEAVHIFNNVANNLGLEVNYHGDSSRLVNDEHQAYFVGWLCGELYEYMQQPKLNTKNKK